MTRLTSAGNGDIEGQNNGLKQNSVETKTEREDIHKKCQRHRKPNVNAMKSGKNRQKTAKTTQLLSTVIY